MNRNDNLKFIKKFLGISIASIVTKNKKHFCDKKLMIAIYQVITLGSVCSGHMYAEHKKTPNSIFGIFQP